MTVTAEQKTKAQRILLIVLCVLTVGSLACNVCLFLYLRFLISEVDYLRMDVAEMKYPEEVTESEPDPFEGLEAPETAQSSEEDPAARALYESQCQSVSYETLNRGGNSLIRQYYTFTGKILQEMEGHYRLGVGDGFSDVIYLDYILPIGAERLLEDDYVTVWGQSLGLYTYTTVSDKEVTVPRLLVGYLDRLTEEEVSGLGQKQYETYAIGETQEYDGCTVTLEKLLVRPTEEEDLEYIGYGSPEGRVTVLALIDCMNNSGEDVEFSRYQYEFWVDGYQADYLYGVSDNPEGRDALSYETMTPGHGIRGYLAFTADSDFQQIELLTDEDDDGNAVSITFRRSGGEPAPE